MINKDEWQGSVLGTSELLFWVVTLPTFPLLVAPTLYCQHPPEKYCHFIQTQLTDDVVVSGMDFLGQWDELLLSVDMAKDEDGAKNHQHGQHGSQHADLRPVVLCRLYVKVTTD